MTTGNCRIRGYALMVVTVLLALSAGGANAEQAIDASGSERPSFTLEFPDGGLANLMRWTPNRIPLVSQHRGGPMPGYPENAIETFANAITFGPGFLEADVRQLKDGTLILMHDDSFDRTTTGTGNVAEADWTTVQILRLVDNEGQETSYKVPTLEAALVWARGRAVINLDIKRGTDIEKVIDLVTETGTDEHVILISYSLDAAKAYHQLAPDLMISVGVRSFDQLEAVKTSGIDPTRVITWSGLQLGDPELYKAIHSEGWRVQLGTLGFDERAIDRQIAATGDDRAYLALFDAGVDMISTDRHWAAQQVLFSPSLIYFYQRPKPVLDIK